MLKRGTLNELMDRAKKEDVDFLIVYNIEVNVVRNVVSNKTQIEVYSVAFPSTTTLASSTSMTNTTVERERENGKGGDPVETGLEKLFKDIEAKLTLGPLPEGLPADKLANHLSEEVKKHPTNPLPLLAQLKFYHSKSLITTDQLKQFCEELIGPEFTGILISGVNEQALVAAIGDKFLPKERPKGK